MALPATDTFTGTNGDPLSANWTVTQGAWQINTNSAMDNTAAFPNLAVWDGDVFANDHYSQATFQHNGSNGAGLGVRLSLVAVTGYYFRVVVGGAGTGEVFLFRLNAGTPTELASFTGLTHAASGDTWRLSVTTVGADAVLALKQNSDPDLTPATGSLTDTSPIASGSAGISSFGNPNVFIDNFEANNLAGGTGLSVGHIGEAVVGGSIF